MRTSVQTDKNDPDETDEWPGSHGTVNESELWIVEGEDIIEQYEPGEWYSYTTTNDDG